MFFLPIFGIIAAAASANSNNNNAIFDSTSGILSSVGLLLSGMVVLSAFLVFKRRQNHADIVLVDEETYDKDMEVSL